MAASHWFSRVVSMSVQILPGIAPLAARYDGFILDLWGLLHNGEKMFPGVVEALDRLKAAGKVICLLSNAPRRRAAVAATLAEMGLEPALYHHLHTSGEATHAALRTPPDPWHAALGRVCLHLGADAEQELLAGLEIRLTDSPEAASFVLNSGVADNHDTLDRYQPLLAACAARRLPMLCANPDQEVLIGSWRALCAGALARHYQTLGGPVRFHGKPYPDVYRQCLRLMNLSHAPHRVVGLGDNLATDIAGARNAGMDAVLALSGIHADAVARSGLATLLAAAPARPSAVIPEFSWSG